MGFGEAILIRVGVYREEEEHMLDAEEQNSNNHVH